MKLKTIFLSALFLSTTSERMIVSSSSQHPNEDMPLLQLPAPAYSDQIPYQLPERGVPVSLITEIKHDLTTQEQAELIEMLARLSLKS